MGNIARHTYIYVYNTMKWTQSTLKIVVGVTTRHSIQGVHGRPINLGDMCNDFYRNCRDDKESILYLLNT